jgi:coenzyme PQQ precursor peptide PqqA
MMSEAVSIKINFLEVNHMWTKPEYTEMRFGFEVTMYIANR